MKSRLPDWLRIALLTIVIVLLIVSYWLDREVGKWVATVATVLLIVLALMGRPFAETSDREETP